MKVITNFGKSIDNLEMKEGLRVKDVLLDLARHIRYNFVSNDELDSNVQIFLNGKDIHFLPKKLDEQLNDQDTLEIYLTPLGGG